MRELRDTYGRRFSYLRLSLTEKCNFRCVYCLPNGSAPAGAESELSLAEIGNLLSAFRKLGFRKVRLTGGEPTVRRDLVDIVALAKAAGFETVALTSNGYLLPNLLGPLAEAGLDRINISLDSLRPEGFAAICGKDGGARARAAIERALEMRFRDVKVNTVLLRGINDGEFGEFLEWLREKPISLRFIELMPTRENGEFFTRHHLPLAEFFSVLRELGWTPAERGGDDGPAQEFRHPEFAGRVGIISPLRRGFCDSCNRLRVSARGALRLCLLGRGDFSLRPLLQSGDQVEDLAGRIENVIQEKRISHELHKGVCGDTGSLSTIGG